MGNVYVRGLAIFQTVEEEPVTANPEQYWHGTILHPLGWQNVLVGGEMPTARKRAHRGYQDSSGAVGDTLRLTAAFQPRRVFRGVGCMALLGYSPSRALWQREKRLGDLFQFVTFCTVFLVSVAFQNLVARHFLDDFVDVLAEEFFHIAEVIVRLARTP